MNSLGKKYLAKFGVGLIATATLDAIITLNAEKIKFLEGEKFDKESKFKRYAISLSEGFIVGVVCSVPVLFAGINFYKTYRRR
mgnify:CR=1 FL=1